MRRITTLLAILVLSLLVACSGGDDDSSDGDSTATSVPATATASPAAKPDDDKSSSISKDNFCAPDTTDAVFDGFDFTTDFDDIEAQAGEIDKLLDAWVSIAPDEIKGDVAVIVDAVKGLFELLDENEFDFIAVATNSSDDPRFTALGSPEFEAANDRLSEYCGYDLGSDFDTGTAFPDNGGTVARLADGSLPDDFPEAFIPPDSEIEFAGLIGPGIGAQFTSTATLEEILAHYQDVLGDPTVTSDGTTIWSIFENNTLTTATIMGTDGAVEIGITISSP